MSDAAGENVYDEREVAPRPPWHANDRSHIVPARVQTVGMWLFLLGLALLFASGMLIYAILRYQMRQQFPVGSFREQMGDWKLFASTVVVLAASFAIHVAVRAVRRERQAKFRRWLWITNVLALLFLIVQTPAMIQLLGRDVGAGPDVLANSQPRDTRIWGLLFVFVLLHAAHVLGGLVYLATVTIKAYAGRYDHEHYVGVKHAALYWHFLDVVWLMMFGTFLLMG